MRKREFFKLPSATMSQIWFKLTNNCERGNALFLKERIFFELLGDPSIENIIFKLQPEFRYLWQDHDFLTGIPKEQNDSIQLRLVKLATFLFVPDKKKVYRSYSLINFKLSLAKLATFYVKHKPKLDSLRSNREYKYNTEVVQLRFIHWLIKSIKGRRYKSRDCRVNIMKIVARTGRELDNSEIHTEHLFLGFLLTLRSSALKTFPKRYNEERGDYHYNVMSVLRILYFSNYRKKKSVWWSLPEFAENYDRRIFIEYFYKQAHSSEGWSFRLQKLFPRQLQEFHFIRSLDSVIEHVRKQNLLLPNARKLTKQNNLQISERKQKKIAKDELKKELKKILKPDLEQSCPELSKCSLNINKLVKKESIDPVIGREEEVNQLIRVLTRKTKNNPLLVGKAGVGKTAIVERLAFRIENHNIPTNLVDTVVVSLDVPSLIAGTRYTGQFESRLQDVIQEASFNSNVLLFVDEFHMIISAGQSEGGSGASKYLKPALARGELRMIGATTLAEFRKFIEGDGAFVRRFEKIVVDEPSRQETYLMINGVKTKYEEFYSIFIPNEIIKTAIRLANQYITNRFFPDKALDLIDEAGAFASVDPYEIAFKERIEEIDELKTESKDLSKLKDNAIICQDFQHILKLQRNATDIQLKIRFLRENQYNFNHILLDNSLTEEHILNALAHKMNLPLTELIQNKQDDSEKLCNMEETLHRKIIGQHQAIRQICACVKRSRTGFNISGRPIGSFLFAGPTGVGKTEVSKTLTIFLFNSVNALLVLDMSEYTLHEAIVSLIGAPPGYSGHDKGGGILTTRIRNNPYTVLLLDEIEKAHPDLFNIFLQILEEGRLTNSKGIVVKFSHAVIILTSNIGADAMLNQQNTESSLITLQIREEIQEFFRPEFLNRLDDMIIFDPLTRTEVIEITRIIIKEAIEKLIQTEVYVDVTERFIYHVTQTSYDPLYGARPLRRTISSLVDDIIMERLISEKIKKGDNITLDASETTTTLNKNISDLTLKILIIANKI